MANKPLSMIIRAHECVMELVASSYEASGTDWALDVQNNGFILVAAASPDPPP